MTAKRARAAAPRRRGVVAKKTRSQPPATTLRLDPRFQEGLALLRQIRKMPLNRMVNEAVGEYLASRAATAEAELSEILRRIRAYRKADPNFESAIARFAAAEAALAEQDAVEGKRRAPAAGPAQRMVRELLRG